MEKLPVELNGGSAGKGNLKKLAVLGAIVVLVIAVLAFAANWWVQKQRYVSTDDAQVSGNLVAVSPQVPGPIQTLYVDEGQQVRAGEIIAKLDDTDYKARVAQAQASLMAARTGQQQAQAGVKAAQANALAAQANVVKSDAEFRRARILFKAGAISRQQYEGAQAADQAANAQYAAAQQQITSAEAAVAVQPANGHGAPVNARIAQARAALHLAQLQLAHTTITSPVTGMVLKRYANVGEMAAPGQPLYDISDSNHVWVVANVEETDINRVRVGAPVDLTIDAYPGRHFQGHVSEIIGATGAEFSLIPQNNAVGNFTKVVQRIPVRIAVDDPMNLLKPGMSAVVNIRAKG